MSFSSRCGLLWGTHRHRHRHRHTDTQTHTHAQTHTDTHRHTHTHRHKHTHTQTHTDTQIPSHLCLSQGAGTLVTDGKQTRVIVGGNPGMAVGGSGDLLTGIIAGSASCACVCVQCACACVCVCVCFSACVPHRSNTPAFPNTHTRARAHNYACQLPVQASWLKDSRPLTPQLWARACTHRLVTAPPWMAASVACCRLISCRTFAGSSTQRGAHHGRTRSLRGRPGVHTRSEAGRGTAGARDSEGHTQAQAQT